MRTPCALGHVKWDEELALYEAEKKLEQRIFPFLKKIDFVFPFGEAFARAKKVKKWPCLLAIVLACIIVRARKFRRGCPLPNGTHSQENKKVHCMMLWGALDDQVPLRASAPQQLSHIYAGCVLRADWHTGMSGCVLISMLVAA